MKVKTYKDKRDKFRWRVKADNGEIIGASTQGFVRRRDCKQNGHDLGIALCKYFGGKG